GGEYREGGRWLVQISAAHGECADFGRAGVDYPALVAPGSETGVLWAEACRRIEWCAAQQRQRAISADREARNAGDGSIHREQELAVVRDFDPARRGLFVREWRAIDRVQYAVARHVVGRNAALVSPVVRVGDKELAGVGGAKLAAEWAGALRGKRRTGCGPQMGVIVDA